MNWYHRAERRYVEYGSSFEATRAFGLFRSLYDTVYNMNMAHLSDEAETVFERLADHGVRTACTPFLIYRGRTRHELGLEGLLRRVALAATFRHATWGPDELFYGELYSSRKVPCKPTLARPGTRDEYSACCGRELVENDLYDFLLFCAARQRLPLAQVRPRRAARVDRARRRRAGRARRRGRWARALPGRARGDRDRRSRADRRRAARCRSPSDWAPSGACCSRTRATPSEAELAVCPSSRAAAVYVLGGRPPGGADPRRRSRPPARPRGRRPVRLAGARRRSRSCAARTTARPRAGSVAVVERAGSELRFRPGSQLRDRRGAGWDLDGDPAALAATVDGGDGELRDRTRTASLGSGRRSTPRTPARS